MIQPKSQQPSIIGRNPQPKARSRRTRKEIPHCEHDRFRLAGRARRKDHQLWVVQLPVDGLDRLRFDCSERFDFLPLRIVDRRNRRRTGSLDCKLFGIGPTDQHGEIAVFDLGGQFRGCQPVVERDEPKAKPLGGVDKTDRKQLCRQQHPDMIAGFDAECGKPACSFVDRRIKPTVGPPHLRVSVD